MTEWILSSSILILIVIALRTCFKGKISLRLQYAIWSLVLLRLLIPVSFGSTNFSVANLTVRSETPASVVQPVKPNENLQADQPVQHPQAQPGEIPSQVVITNEPLADAKAFNLKANAIYFVWGVGFIFVAGMFLVTNIRFKRKVMDSRYRLEVQKDNLDVYATGEIDTPCLFGIKKPAIYVTYSVADNQTLLHHTLEHEATHYRHGDHIWAILRCVCLAIHWYNPLVWWAAFLSQRDAELACDEATIQCLGEGERAEYGRTLIGMTCQKKANILITATTMAVCKSGLKERIVLIAKKPKMALYTLLLVVLVSAIAVGCTFTGAKEEEPDVMQTPPPITESTESTQGIQSKETEPTEATLPESVIVLPGSGILYEKADQNKICIAVQPTGMVFAGDEHLYIIPEDQVTLLEYFTAAKASAHKYTLWDSSNQCTGWRIVYQGQWWHVTESGAMFSTDRKTWDDICIDADDAKQLYELCDAAVKETGIGEPVRPADITEIKSATLYWNGAHTVTDEYALNKIEKWLVNSREDVYGASCWFTAQLALELENGETKTIAMATDSCAAWMSEGVAYGFGEITEEGINGNEEFYSLFAPAVIYERSKDGMDALHGVIVYLNWSYYANKYGADEAFALMNIIEEWAAEDPTYDRFGGAIHLTNGLAGVYADYYAGMLARLYALAPSEFAWACLGNASDANEKQTLEMLADHWNITAEEIRTKLETDIAQN